jgi:hypothetical protein
MVCLYFFRYLYLEFNVQRPILGLRAGHRTFESRGWARALFRLSQVRLVFSVEFGLSRSWIACVLFLFPGRVCYGMDMCSLLMLKREHKFNCENYKVYVYLFCDMYVEFKVLVQVSDGSYFQGKVSSSRVLICTS